MPRERARAAQLSRWTKRYPKEADDVVNALAKVRYLRGEPSEHTCALCGAAADEWQVTRFDEIEGTAFLAYSDEVNDYDAQCSPCALGTHEWRLKALNEWRHA
ncbi:hypothetical protein [Streptomyces sp. NPDC002758]